MKLGLKILCLLSLLSLLNACKVGRFVIWNFADIKDYKKFKSVPIENDESTTFKFEKLDTLNLNKQLKFTIKEKKYSFDEVMKKAGTVAFLVIKDDKILYENYFKGYDSSSITTSFSVAKSFVSALIGIAIKEGYIDAVEDPITKYIPTLAQDPYGNITIEHLLDMRSGIDYNESYINPFGNVATSYYGLNLKKHSKRQKKGIDPDQKFDYISLNTQLLAWVLEEATGNHVSDYLEAKIWKPLGMEYPASWSIDSKKNRTEKAFCCLNARARDFAKFGRLYLHQGDWNGQEVISKEWIKASLDFDKNSFYSYQWWCDPIASTEKEQDFYAQGILGQFIYVNPEKNTIIVRLGKKHGSVNWPNLFRAIARKLT